jgi:small subunit ribosomal protein S20
LYRRSQRFPIGMDGQKLHPHRGHSGCGSTNGFFDIEKLEIEEDALPSPDQACSPTRSISRSASSLDGTSRAKIRRSRALIDGTSTSSHDVVGLTLERAVWYKLALFQQEYTMPVIHKSTIRRARQSEKRHDRNRAALGTVKSLVKKVQTAVAEKKTEDAKTSLRIATSAISKAVSKGLVKPNTASRRISRLTIHVNSLATSRS